MLLTVLLIVALFAAAVALVCDATLMTVPFGARTKNRRMPHGSSVSG